MLVSNLSVLKMGWVEGYGLGSGVGLPYFLYQLITYQAITLISHTNHIFIYVLIHLSLFLFLILWFFLHKLLFFTSNFKFLPKFYFFPHCFVTLYPIVSHFQRIVRLSSFSPNSQSFTAFQIRIIMYCLTRFSTIFYLFKYLIVGLLFFRSWLSYPP